jgi:RNA polymerase sigma-70 factor (ECF subfamily)
MPKGCRCYEKARGDVVVEAEDSVAIRRCQQGDIDALGILVARYQHSALRLAFLLIGSQTLAEDVVQEAFLAAHHGLPRFNLAQPFAPWFYRIVTNTARMHYRTRNRHAAVSLDTVLEDGADTNLRQDTTAGPEQHVERDELRREVGRLLAALTTAQREVIVLRYYYGYSDQEIAEIVGCRVPAARQRLYGGLHALKRLVSQRSSWLLDEIPSRSTEASDAT